MCCAMPRAMTHTMIDRGYESKARRAPERRSKTRWQLIAFAAVGVLATATHYATALVASASVGLYLGYGIGYIVALGASYTLHQTITFRACAPGLSGQRFVRFVAVSLLAMSVSQVGLWVGTHMLRLPNWQALGLAAAIAPAITFVLSKAWVFRVRGSEPAQ